MASHRPNVLFLLSDQHQHRALGFQGHPVVETPNLDALAGQGIVFDNAYAPSPLCVPSRASLLTGLYPRNHGLYDNQHILEANSPTLPRMIQAHGYRTALIGKAHFNGEQYHGFQERPYGDLWGQAHQPDPGRLPENGESGLGDIIKNAGPSAIPLALTQTEIVVAESVKWLQQHRMAGRTEPFYLAVHFDKPHFPFNPPNAYYQRYQGRVSLPPFDPEFLHSAVPFVRQAAKSYQASRYYGTTDEASHLRCLAAYYGCITWVDDAVGRILDALDYLHLAKDTLVIYAADHGEMAGEHGLWQKTVFYDASAKVPLIIRMPQSLRVEPGRRAVPVSLVDLLPTILEAAAIPLTDPVDGVSLGPLLGTAEALWPRTAIFSESTVLKSPEDSGCMMRTSRYKCNWYLDGAVECYDLEADPYEQVNLATDPAYRDQIATWVDQIHQFWQPERQRTRYEQTPRMRREKHFYPYSNQFVSGTGAIIDAIP